VGGEALGFAATVMPVPQPLTLPALTAHLTFGNFERVEQVRPGARLAALYSRLVAAAGLKQVAVQTGPAPSLSDGQIAKIASFGLPRMRGGLVFTATLHHTSGIDRSNDFGVWREQLSGGNSDLVLRNGSLIGARKVAKLALMSPVPNASDQRRSFASDGTLGAAVKFSDGSSGVTVVAGNGVTTVPVDTAAVVPDAVGMPVPGAKFSAFSDPATGSGGRYAVLASFSANAQAVPIAVSQGIFALRNSLLQRILERGEKVPGRPGLQFGKVGQPLMGESGTIGLIAALTGVPQKAPPRKAIVLLDGRVKAVVARLGEHAPGLEEGVVYRRFLSVEVTDSDPARLLFTAIVTGPPVTARNNYGLWSVSTAKGVNLLLRTEDPVEVNGATQLVRSFEVLQAARKNVGQGRSTDASGFVTVKAKLGDGRSSILRIQLP
jgi:hypothetical protein